MPPGGAGGGSTKLGLVSSAAQDYSQVSRPLKPSAFLAPKPPEGGVPLGGGSSTASVRISWGGGGQEPLTPKDHQWKSVLALGARGLIQPAHTSPSPTRESWANHTSFQTLSDSVIGCRSCPSHTDIRQPIRGPCSLLQLPTLPAALQVFGTSISPKVTGASAGPSLTHPSRVIQVSVPQPWAGSRSVWAHLPPPLEQETPCVVGRLMPEASLYPKDRLDTTGANAVNIHLAISKVLNSAFKGKKRC